MKIIQLYYPSPSELNVNVETFRKYFLSFLLLKETYGKVTMKCNKLGYEAVVKYIPYDDIIIEEIDDKIYELVKCKALSSFNEPILYVDVNVLLYVNVLETHMTINEYLFYNDKLETNIFGVKNPSTLLRVYDDIKSEIHGNRYNSEIDISSIDVESLMSLIKNKRVKKLSNVIHDENKCLLYYGSDHMSNNSMIEIKINKIYFDYLHFLNIFTVENNLETETNRIVSI